MDDLDQIILMIQIIKMIQIKWRLALRGPDLSVVPASVNFHREISLNLCIFLKLKFFETKQNKKPAMPTPPDPRYPSEA